MTTKTGTSIKYLVAFSFLVMVTVNALANIIPINGVNTGQVSDSYQNLFAPAGITFAIWGLIYFLLAAYTLYQLGFFQNNQSALKTDILDRVGIYFTISSIANTLWIFSWHYHLIPLSMLLMVIILICLILIVNAINKAELSFKDKIFVRLPFSIYFGWITVATIANATALLVSIGWDGFGISEPVWAVIIILVGVIIAIATILKNKDFAYGLTIIWAYSGILIKHISAEGFAGQYPTIITTVIICIALVLIIEVFLLLKKRTLSN